ASCSCVGGSVTLTGTVRSQGADTDPARLVRTTARVWTEGKTKPNIVDGAIVLTDVIVPYGGTSLWIAADCTKPMDSALVADQGATLVHLTGVRILLAKGESLCASGNGYVTVTG